MQLQTVPALLEIPADVALNKNPLITEAIGTIT